MIIVIECLGSPLTYATSFCQFWRIRRTVLETGSGVTFAIFSTISVVLTPLTQLTGGLKMREYLSDHIHLVAIDATEHVLDFVGSVGVIEHTK